METGYFDISVHDVHGVHVVDGIADAVEDAPDHAFVLEPVFTDIIKKCSILCILEDYVSDLGLLVKSEVIHFYDVRMVQFHMDLHFIKRHLPVDLLHRNRHPRFQAFSQLYGSIRAKP